MLEIKLNIVYGFSHRCLEEQRKPQWVLGSEIYPLLKPSLKITCHPENQHGSPEKTRVTAELWFPAHPSSRVIVFWHSFTIFLFLLRVWGLASRSFALVFKSPSQILSLDFFWVKLKYCIILSPLPNLPRFSNSVFRLKCFQTISSPLSERICDYLRLVGGSV